MIDDTDREIAVARTATADTGRIVLDPTESVALHRRVNAIEVALEHTIKVTDKATSRALAVSWFAMGVASAAGVVAICVMLALIAMRAR